MAQPIELVIDLVELEAAAQRNPVIPIERPKGIASGVLGFSALDLSEIQREHLPIVETGLLVEAAAGSHLYPNTIDAVWAGPDGQLSVAGLHRVARNTSLWRA